MSLFVKFNENQYKKIEDHITKIIIICLKMLDIYHFHQISLKKIKQLFKNDKIKENNIINKSIRAAYFDITKKIFYELADFANEINSIEHVNAFIKIGIGQYIEKNFYDLPRIEIDQEDDSVHIFLGGNSFIIDKKIKSKNDEIFLLKDGKKYSTNNYGKHIVKQSIQVINKIKEVLNLIVNELECTKSALIN